MSADIRVTAQNYKDHSSSLVEMKNRRSAWDWSKNYISVDQSGTISLVQLNLFERILRVLFGCISCYHDTQLSVVKERLMKQADDQPHVKAALAIVDAVWKKSHPDAAETALVPLKSGAADATTVVSRTPKSSNVAIALKHRLASMVIWAFPRRNIILACLDQKEFFGKRVLDCLDTTSQRQLLHVNREFRELPKHRLFHTVGNPFASMPLEKRIQLMTENVVVYSKILVDGGHRGGSGDTTHVHLTRQGQMIEVTNPMPEGVVTIWLGSRQGRGMVSTSKAKDLPGFQQLATRALLPGKKTDSYDSCCESFASDRINPIMFTALFDVLAVSGRQYTITSLDEAMLKAHFAERLPKYITVLRNQNNARPTVESLKALITSSKAKAED